MIIGSSARGSDAGTGSAAGDEFVAKLWQGAFDGRCKELVGTHADKVVAALLECGCTSVKQVRFWQFTACNQAGIHACRNLLSALTYHSQSRLVAGA